MRAFLWILPLVVALSSCSSVQDGYDEYRQTHEAAVAFEVRGGFLWLGFGVRKVGRDAEIETKEAQVAPILSSK